MGIPLQPFGSLCSTGLAVIFQKLAAHLGDDEICSSSQKSESSRVAIFGAGQDIGVHDA